MDDFLDQTEIDRLYRLMDQLALKLGETHSLATRRQLIETNLEIVRLKRAAAMDTLNDAFARCRSENMRTLGVLKSLDYLQARAVEKRPFKQFLDALAIENDKDRWQAMNASLNAIKRQAER